MNFFEKQFPGNTSSLEKIVNAISSETVIALTGAGTSMPALPSWGALIAQLINDAEADGLFDASTIAALRGETSDYLYVVDEISKSTSAAHVRAKVVKLFSGLTGPTAAHSAIMRTNYTKLMTLNYDNGLEMAASQLFGQHVQGIHGEQEAELLNWEREESFSKYPRILHWHGNISETSSIVLSGDDYSNFYSESRNKIEFLRGIFRTKRVIMIGFGFTDPFIVTQLNTVMQPLPATNSHFAIIGVRDDLNFNVHLERRKFLTKYKMDVVFYPVDVSNGAPDHSELLTVLDQLSAQCPVEPISNREVGNETGVVVSEKRPTTYRSTLFSVGDRQIYCEPNLWSISADPTTTDEVKISVSELVSLNDHCSISAPHEYGLSNLGRRIANELEALSQSVMFRDAGDIPNYRKKIAQDELLSKKTDSEKFTLVIDNFSSVEHQRMLRELLAVFSGIRIVVLQRQSLGSDTFDDEISELGFRRFQLRGLSRLDIRRVVEVTAPENNSDATSAIVDKVYSDLLQLCIPLTPSNVVMYASVVCKDGAFSPVSRLHIIERFVIGALQRASDAYADAFNAANKVDLISAFCFQIFQKNAWAFTRSDWRNFCEEYKKKTLDDFSSSEILGDLIHGKIVVRDGEFHYFRYRMFFSYFVGKQVAAHPEILNACIADNRHLELDGLVEVLCGLLPDSSGVLNDISEKLEAALLSFYESYPISNLDLHDGVVWEREEDETLIWDSVSDKVDEGPVEGSELDELKTSIHAERRTEDQKVSIIKFIASEHSVSRMRHELNVALNSAKFADADAKIRAMKASIDSHKLAYEVATIFVPLIAERKYVSWNGFTYINLINDREFKTSDAEENRVRMEGMVTLVLPGSMARGAANRLGSRKHGKVFSAILQSNPERPLDCYMLFVLIISSKPKGWLAIAKKAVSETKRDDIYLRHMLNAALHQYRREINTEAERSELKDLIASIRVRRDTNVKSPNKALIKKAISKLDDSDYWSREKDEAQ